MDSIAKSDNTADVAAESPASSAKITDVVLLVHGIRTHAAWQVMVTEALESPTIRVIPIKYGYFNSLRFLAPFETSRKPVERLEREIRAVRKRFPSARISIIAHSFGTYVVSKVLQEETDIDVHRVIFCGSVVKEDFRWDKVGSRVGDSEAHDGAHFIINECGTRDIWPILGKSAGWGYGAAGTDGFGTSLVHDRYHKGGHALYFNRAFVERYWKPFIHHGEVERGEGDPNESVPLYLRALGALPLNWLILIGLLLMIGYPAYCLLFREPPPQPLGEIALSYEKFVAAYPTSEARREFIGLNRGNHVEWKCRIREVGDEGSSPYLIAAPVENGGSESDQSVFIFDGEDKLVADLMPEDVVTLSGLLGAYDSDFIRFHKSRVVDKVKRHPPPRKFTEVRVTVTTGEENKDVESFFTFVVFKSKEGGIGDANSPEEIKDQIAIKKVGADVEWEERHVEVVRLPIAPELRSLTVDSAKDFALCIWYGSRKGDPNWIGVLQATGYLEDDKNPDTPDKFELLPATEMFEMGHYLMPITGQVNPALINQLRRSFPFP